MTTIQISKWMKMAMLSGLCLLFSYILMETVPDYTTTTECAGCTKITYSVNFNQVWHVAVSAVLALESLVLSIAAFEGWTKEGKSE